MSRCFTVVVERDPESRWLVGEIVESDRNFLLGAARRSAWRPPREPVGVAPALAVRATRTVCQSRGGASDAPAGG